jgi:hypothetical protein
MHTNKPNVFSHSSLHFTSDLGLPHYIAQENQDSLVSILTSGKFKNEWSYTSTPPNAFTVSTETTLPFTFYIPQDSYICLLSNMG